MAVGQHGRMSAEAQEAQDEEHRAALGETLNRGRAVLEADGDAGDAVQAAIAYMEDAVQFFNAGRGSVLCADGSVEMAAALMRGRDRGAGAVALIRRTRQPIFAAAAVLERSPHVLLSARAPPGSSRCCINSG
jgi:beta-aspartyl-peptidase (threonine type)